MPNIVLAQPLPAPRCAITVRSATTADLPFIDSLQKMHSHMVGWFPMKQFEGHIAQGNILIAEEAGGPEACGLSPEASDAARLKPHGSGLRPVPPTPLGYCLSRDQYMKRDDVGIIYQLNVAPLKQRNLIGASRVKAVFEKAAYGCKLFCCWCAQDIQANWFWESTGFVPLAFRSGSRGKQRIHIYWQRRIREGDETSPYWFPSQTTAGAVREDRIVLPIPPGTHWRDAKPLVLPQRSACAGTAGAEGSLALPANLPGGAPVKPRPEQPKLTAAQKAAIHRAHSKHLQGVPLGKKAVLTGGGIKYVERTDFVAETDTPEELAQPAKAKKPRAPRQKNDPKHIAAARELRDRFLDQVNAGLILPGGGGAEGGAGKYDVSRQLPAAPNDVKPVPAPHLLKAA